MNCWTAHSHSKSPQNPAQFKKLMTIFLMSEFRDGGFVFNHLEHLHQCSVCNPAKRKFDKNLFQKSKHADLAQQNVLGPVFLQDSGS
jgi:hypothetical protein